MTRRADHLLMLTTWRSTVRIVCNPETTAADRELLRKAAFLIFVGACVLPPEGPENALALTSLLDEGASFYDSETLAAEDQNRIVIAGRRALRKIAA